MAKEQHDAVRDLIERRLSELNLDRKTVSEQIGRNNTYLHQFLHRGTPAVLREADRIRLAEILRVSETELLGPAGRAARHGHYAKEMGAAAQKTIAPPSPTDYDAPSRNPPTIPSVDLIGRADLPVFGTAQGGESGALVITDQAVDFVARPIALMRVQDGYGIIVAGDSMEPEHKAGSTALVNPHAKPRVGDSCIFRSHGAEGSTLILIKTYCGETETHWKVSQHNPPRKWNLPKKEWQVCHKTVGNYFA